MAYLPSCARPGRTRASVPTLIFRSRHPSFTAHHEPRRAMTPVLHHANLADEAQVPHEGCQTKGWVRAEAGPGFLRLFVAYTGLLEGDGLPTAAFLHIDAGEQDLPVHILSSHGSLDGGLAGNHCGVAIDAHLHIGKLVGGELGFAGFECVYHFRLA